MRNVQEDPRRGDIVQAVPGLVGDVWPAPLTVIEVNERFVVWERYGQRRATERGFWRSPRSLMGPPLRLELIEEARA